MLIDVVSCATLLIQIVEVISYLIFMSYQFQTYTIASRQEDLERHLLELSVVDREQLAVAKRWQERQEGPLLMVLLQLSFIDLHQFSGLLDWSGQGG
jgi:hypothetical protein